MPDTAPARAGEEPDLARLTRYLREKLPGMSGGLEIEQFPNGHSNLVYLVRTGNAEYVLRRPPLGPLPAKAHDMAREYRVLDAVHPHFPEAPRVVWLCEDPAVLGATFFLMERRRGMVLREAMPAEWVAMADCPRRVSEAFVDCLARLHDVDVRSPRIAALGKPDGYVERQVRGWTERWHAAGTEPLPEMDRVAAWLRERVPASHAATLVHNDFKVDNVMLSARADGVDAVLDWEMATLGDPLADLGMTLCYWTSEGSVTAGPGWFSRDEFAQRYAARTGRDLTHLGYHEVLGIFKLAVILQQIYFRFQRGQTQDERFRGLNGRVRDLARRAAGMVDQTP